MTTCIVANPDGRFRRATVRAQSATLLPIEASADSWILETIEGWVVWMQGNLLKLTRLDTPGTNVEIANITSNTVIRPSNTRVFIFYDTQLLTLVLSTSVVSTVGTWLNSSTGSVVLTLDKIGNILRAFSAPNFIFASAARIEGTIYLVGTSTWGSAISQPVTTPADAAGAASGTPVIPLGPGNLMVVTGAPKIQERNLSRVVTIYTAPPPQTVDPSSTSLVLATLNPSDLGAFFNKLHVIPSPFPNERRVSIWGSITLTPQTWLLGVNATRADGTIHALIYELPTSLFDPTATRQPLSQRLTGLGTGLVGVDMVGTPDGFILAILHNPATPDTTEVVGVRGQSVFWRRSFWRKPSLLPGESQSNPGLVFDSSSGAVLFVSAMRAEDVVVSENSMPTGQGATSVMQISALNPSTGGLVWQLSWSGISPRYGGSASRGMLASRNGTITWVAPSVSQLNVAGIPFVSIQAGARILDSAPVPLSGSVVVARIVLAVAGPSEVIGAIYGKCIAWPGNRIPLPGTTDINVPGQNVLIEPLTGKAVAIAQEPTLVMPRVGIITAPGEMLVMR